jgi:hypothetical protein
MSRPLALATICCLYIALAGSQLHAQTTRHDTWSGYVSGISDLPLVAGLTEDVDAALVFDKPSGRIVEAFASGMLTRSEVVSFYAHTLPELGWRHLGNLAFARENEVLRIIVNGNGGAVTVRFLLAPM